jgi:hypothetical protein
MLDENSKFMLLHHIGMLVDDSSMKSYQSVFGDHCVSDKIIVLSQNVYICFVDIGKDVFLELIQPIDESSVVYKLRKKNVSYYHLGYTTEIFDLANKKLIEAGFRIINQFDSEAFEGGKCQFMYTPEGDLIELVEKRM